MTSKKERVASDAAFASAATDRFWTIVTKIDAVTPRPSSAAFTASEINTETYPLLSLLDGPESFKSKVNELVAQQRATLKLPALDCHPF